VNENSALQYPAQPTLALLFVKPCYIFAPHFIPNIIMWQFHAGFSIVSSQTVYYKKLEHNFQKLL